MTSPSSSSDQQPGTTTSARTHYVTTKRVSCDGGGGALGHPLVWYNIEDGEAVCAYCGAKFIYRNDTDDA